MPQVSVVIPTYNRLPRLQRVLEGLRAQTVPSAAVEVIVVSDGSEDGTNDYLSSGATPVPVIFIAQANQGPASARNSGVMQASAELVLFLDDDVVPLPTLLEEHIEAHKHHGPDVVVLGPMLTPPDVKMTPWVGYEQAMLYKQYAAMTQGSWEPTARQFYTGNASVERRHVLEAGGFDPRFTRAEDVELAYRLAARGVRFKFVPAAAGHHYAERGYASWCRTAYLYGRNDIIFARDKGQDWLLSAIANEFTRHHVLLRAVTLMCLERPALSRPVRGVCRLLAALPAMGMKGVSRAPLSVVYNLTYYQGIADELGSWKGLLRPASVPAAAHSG